MRLELWMIAGAGAAFAIGFGAVTVLILALHAEVRRLTKLAEGIQKALAGNLRRILADSEPPPRQPRPVPRESTPAAEPAAAAVAIAPPLVKLAQATLAQATEPGAGPPGVPDSLTQWNPDRRLLVMRLASRGKTADQIAAALRIPQEEVELFLEVNRLVPSPP